MDTATAAPAIDAALYASHAWIARVMLDDYTTHEPWNALSIDHHAQMLARHTDGRGCQFCRADLRADMVRP